MRCIVYFTLLIFLLLSKSSHGLILMELGEQKKFPSPYGEKITLSQPGLISIQEEGTFIILKARKTGTLFLDQGSTTRWIKILPKNKKIKWENFLNLIENTPWLDWSFSNNQVDISGSMYRFEDWQKIAQTSKINQIPYTLNADISDKVKKDFLNFFQSQKPFQILWNKPLKIILPSYINFEFSHYGIQTERDDNSFNPPLVELNLLLTEVISNHTLLSNASFSLIQDPLHTIQSQFHRYKNKGTGHILTSTKLITENKKSARFFLGGEVSIPQYHNESKSISTHFKPYGLSLSFTPQIYSNKKIHLQLETEISEIDHSLPKGSTKNHRIHSEITIPEGQSLLLSHFQRKSTGENKAEPKSFSFPLFGSFLRQKNLNKEKTKSIIFITPRILSP